MSRRDLLISFVAGASSVLAFAPFGWFPLVYLALAWLFFCWHRSTPLQALFNGYAFGLGLMGFGVFWIHVSISQFGGVTYVLAVMLALLFAAFMALYFALAGWLSVRLARQLKCGALSSLLLVFPAVFTLVELLRAYLLTGFPWLSLGYSQLLSPLSALAPVMGVFGVSWLVTLLAGLLVLLVNSRRNRLRSAIGIGLLLIMALSVQRIDWSQPQGDMLSVRLVQGNIPQEIKWQPSMLQPTIQRYREMGFAEQADLVIWPETAIPAYAHRVQQTLLEPLQRELEARGTSLVVGIPVRDSDQAYFNSMLSLGGSQDRYDKRHLVPFGEYAPLDFLLRPLVDYFRIPMSDFSAGTAAQPLLQVGEHAVGVSVCYEDAFGSETVQSFPAAAYLINISNDAWFGDSLAPYQHLEIARMRALETARPMLRATNTGISAIIDHHGRVVSNTGLNTTEVLTGKLQPRTGMTLYAVTGDYLVMGLMLLLLAIVFVVSRANLVRA